MLPELYNIVARWNKEAGVGNVGIKINEIRNESFNLHDIIINIFANRLGALIGKKGCLIKKYRKEISDFYKENYPKSHPHVEIRLNELNEMVGQEEIDVDKYYQDVIRHVSEN